ncbi:uncharacterized protein LOC113296115 [Papaver somniferum]|uniref:uncharacterized protein LOC113296115 n=1 Tax=Papaver somniferum TaxID=3469 RepID=UPI000E704CA6|nr:uncharacterized protein LOC113296115 [Papaver somniferum]
MGGGKKPKTKKARKPTVFKSNISILDFDVADVTPLTTIQTSDTNASITPIQTSDVNISVTFEEILPGGKETVVDQEKKDAPIIDSHRRMILAERRFESSCSQLELSQQNVSLEKEVNRLKVELQEVQKLKGELQVANLDAENLHLNQQRVLERYTFQFLAEDTQANNEKLQTQLNQLNNQHSYSLDHINNLTHENNHLIQEIEVLNSQISHFSKLSRNADLIHETLSEENHTFSREKHSFLSKEAMFSHQYSILQKINEDQARSLRSLEVHHETLLKDLKTQNEKIIQSKISLTEKKNQLQEQYNQLRHSHDALKKKNKSLSADEKKIRSRLNGSVDDDIDKAMESMKNNTLLLSKFCEGSHLELTALLLFNYFFELH